MNEKEKQDLLDALIKNKRGDDDTLKPNTWEWVEAVRAELQTDTDNYPWRAASENLWAHVTEIQDDEYLGIERNYIGRSNPLEYLADALEIPRYPPLEVLVAISDAFQIYLKAQGRLSLEDVFFGPSKKGVGNYSARKSKNDMYLYFQMFLQMRKLECFRKELPQLSTEEAAIEFMSGGFESIIFDQPKGHEYVDSESFLRGFRRWKKANEHLFEEAKADN